MSNFIGLNIRKIREFRGMTQAEVAEKSGISLNSYQLIESGQTKSPKSANLSEICKTLKASPELVLSSDFDISNLDSSTPNKAMMDKLHDFIMEFKKANGEVPVPELKKMQMEIDFVKEHLSRLMSENTDLKAQIIVRDEEIRKLKDKNHELRLQNNELRTKLDMPKDRYQVTDQDFIDMGMEIIPDEEIAKLAESNPGEKQIDEFYENYIEKKNPKKKIVNK